MNNMASGVVQLDATTAEFPTTSTTVSSTAAAAIACRAQGKVSIRPLARSTTPGSWCSQPAWFSSEPR